MSRTGQTVFIIDDDESVRRALTRLMRSAGLVAESFATAEEFLRRAGGPTPDCLILDVHLPGLSGLELQERLTAGGRDVPVVFITAYAEEAAREQAMRAGAIAFLAKPFEEQALLDAVAIALCPRRGAGGGERAPCGDG
jgi:FixJ family two-component response regulator